MKVKADEVDVAAIQAAVRDRIRLRRDAHVAVREHDCWIEVDVVQEDVSWFAQRGSTPARVRCRVDGGEAPRPRVPKPRPAGAAEPPPPFRVRHPHWYRVSRATGLRDAYWAWRRTVDRIKTVRDGVLARVRPPVVNWLKRRRTGLYMEMHCIAHADVMAIVTTSGGRVADAEEERTRDFQNYRYWVVKSREPWLA